MSSFSTFTPSLAHTYCCLRREPHPLCSQLNATAALVSLVENNLIGTETRPKESVAEPIGRAGIGGGMIQILNYGRNQEPPR